MPLPDAARSEVASKASVLLGRSGVEHRSEANTQDGVCALRSGDGGLQRRFARTPDLPLDDAFPLISRAYRTGGAGTGLRAAGGLETWDIFREGKAEAGAAEGLM